MDERVVQREQDALRGYIMFHCSRGMTIGSRRLERGWIPMALGVG